MKAAVALLVSVSLLGCFPNNAKHRMYAQWAEGGALVGGIVVAAVGNTGADCDQMMTGVEDCKDKAKWLSTIGVTLILAGLLGFVATISTAEDDEDSAKRVISVEKTPPPGGTEPATGSGSATGTGTGSDTAPAPTDGTGSAAAPAPGAGSAAPATTP